MPFMRAFVVFWLLFVVIPGGTIVFINSGLFGYESWQYSNLFFLSRLYYLPLSNLIGKPYFESGMIGATPIGFAGEAVGAGVYTLLAAIAAILYTAIKPESRQPGP